jgi:hypothetical protein
MIARPAVSVAAASLLTLGSWYDSRRCGHTCGPRRHAPGWSCIFSGSGNATHRILIFVDRRAVLDNSYPGNGRIEDSLGELSARAGLFLRSSRTLMEAADYF